MPHGNRNLGPPWWILRIYPELRDVEDNPVYLKLTGKRFRGRPKWWRRFSPPELKAGGVGGLAGIGCLPFVLLILFWPAGLILLIARALGRGGDSRPPVQRFVMNAAREPWGQELYLSALTPADYDHALLAYSVERSVRPVAQFIGALAPGVMIGLIALYTDAMAYDSPGIDAGPALVFSACGWWLAGSFVFAAQTSIISLISALTSVTSTDEHFDPGFALGLSGALIQLMVFSSSHLIGVSLASLLAYNDLFLVRIIDYDLGSSGLARTFEFLFVMMLANAPVQWFFIRSGVRDLRGGVWKALLRMREREEAKMSAKASGL